MSATTSRRRFLTTALAAGACSTGLVACSDGTPPNSSAVPGGTDSRPAGGSNPPTAVPVTTGRQALDRLLAGNARFVAEREERLDEGVARRVAVSKGQHPFATVLGCVDSRVPIELVFDQGLGDLVVVRSAGEALDHSVTGSLEFGVAELHTPLLVVLGHQRCGALDATIKAVDAKQRTAEAGQIGYLVETLAPAVRQVAGQPGDRLTNAIHANVDMVLGKLRQSPVIGPLERAGKVELVGAYYELDTGKVIVS
ncbi:carbonic anhydrase [Kribbella sandramycini]|uniref:Carbonic anhydrase n=1 Tax=Kribbella sandramycini TaxID=60450 RepID=A0A841SIF8_9ACTN|nr:carbonic anhydrase [Kribbella sandramycini]MBB6569360.1 carbonic anhydrase [Kribbella sandramycini]